MKWITRERPKIDRIACPWLIRRFIDPKAEIIYVQADQVLSRADELGATPFDIPNVEYSHYEEKSTFDYFLMKHKISDPALDRIALIVRGADTDQHQIAPEAAGLWAISAGLAHNIKDDHQLLEMGMVIYDGLYSWAQHLYKVRHLDNSPFERLLHEVYQNYLKQPKSKKAPGWVKELRELIQDRLDDQYTVDLKEIATKLDLNPSYVSREFSKYFDQLNFAEYIRKARIEKAIQLMSDPQLTLTEIAYLAGFSDQSHFTRIFKKLTGQNPGSYRKTLPKR